MFFSCPPLPPPERRSSVYCVWGVKYQIFIFSRRTAMTLCEDNRHWKNWLACCPSHTYIYIYINSSGCEIQLIRFSEKQLYILVCFWPYYLDIPQGQLWSYVKIIDTGNLFACSSSHIYKYIYYIYKYFGLWNTVYSYFR